MCGITGFLTPSDIPEADLQARVLRMADQIVHRGPDDCGTWVEVPPGIAFGFRRLAILDLTSLGHQPMVSASTRYVIVFNGEVYNFHDLRRELAVKGHTFSGGSDTEVMLAAIEEWGLETAVNKFVGMFAFALWDRHERSLHLVRDRLGIKPLYYGWAGKTFLFGSELKALRAHPDFVPTINRDALALQMRHNYVPQPYSIYKGIHKLSPGCILTVKAIHSPMREHAGPFPYWSAKEVWTRGYHKPFKGSEQEAVDQLESLLKESVRMRMIADVPLGGFLSGGIDSSTVVALMQLQSSRPVKTFTIGFYEDNYDEAKDAKKVASHLGTEHTELYVTPEEARAVIPKLPVLFDEPFSDSSQIPTFLVSALARRHVTVSLSGDGGDELFGGYDRYFLCHSMWRKVGWLPAGCRRWVARLIRILDVETYNSKMGWLTPLLARYGRPRPVGEKMYRLADVLGIQTPVNLYHQLVSHWKRPEAVVLGAEEPATAFTDSARRAIFSTFYQKMMLLDLITYLPDDILTKVDRASMGTSLEARLPLLDHRVVEFASRVPLHMKIRNGQGKRLLRQVLYRHVPRELVERPKMGFGVPIGAWLRGPLREWAEELLDEGRLTQEGYFRPELIRRLWAEHLAGVQDWNYYLWDVLMFQAWLEEWA